MSEKDYSNLREDIKNNKYSLEIEEVINPMSSQDKRICVDSMTIVGDKEEEFKDLTDKYQIAIEIDDVIDDYENQKISKIEEMWQIGKLIEETEDENFPNLQILGNIFSNKRGYSSDSFSVHRQIYKAFPNKNYDNKNHDQTEIREFIMQPKNKKRGREGYEKYKNKSYDWPKPVRRAWCVTEESKLNEDKIIEKFAQRMKNKYESSNTVTPSSEVLESYLVEMTDLSQHINKISQNKAGEYI